MDEVVIPFPGQTTLEIEPDKVLSGPVGELKAAIVLGYRHDGEPYFASSLSSAGENLLLAELFKAMLLRETDNG